MNLPGLQNLPDEAQMWVFGFGEPLGADDKARIGEELDAFVQQWKSHDLPVAGAYQILHDRFVALAGYCSGGLSGCSIDSCVGIFKSLKLRVGLDGLNRGLVFYRDSHGQVQSTSRATFQQKLDSGEITSQTPTFDTSLQTLGQLRSGAFEKTFKSCWHARVFRLPVV